MSKKYTSLEHIIRNIRESVGILGSKDPKGNRAAFTQSVHIEPKVGDAHPNPRAFKISGQRKVAKQATAQPIKMEENMSTMGGDSSAGHNPIASTPETESGKKKKSQKESGYESVVPNTFKEETVNREKKRSQPGLTVIPKTNVSPNERVKKTFDDMDSAPPAPNQGDAPATSNSPTTSSRESGPVKKKLKESHKEKNVVPRTAAMSTDEKTRKDVYYVDRNNDHDRKSTESKQARQAAFKTKVIDESKSRLHQIIRETLASGVADGNRNLKKRNLIIPTKNLKGQSDPTEIAFHPDLKKVNPNQAQ